MMMVTMNRPHFLSGTYRCKQKQLCINFLKLPYAQGSYFLHLSLGRREKYIRANCEKVFEG